MKEISLKEAMLQNPNQPMSLHLADLYAASKSHRAVVLVASGTLEFFLNTVISAKLKKHGGFFEKQHSLDLKIHLLHEMEIIDDNQYRVLIAVKDIRNKVAHKEKLNISPKELNQLGRFAPDMDFGKVRGNVLYPHSMMPDFKLDVKDEDYVYMWFYVLLTDFWHSFGDILIPKFHPISDRKKYKIKPTPPKQN